MDWAKTSGVFREWEAHLQQMDVAFKDRLLGRSGAAVPEVKQRCTLTEDALFESVHSSI